MKFSASPGELLRTIASIGYFDAPTASQDRLTRLVEDRFNVGVSVAVERLTDAGLVVFRYSQDPALHTRERVDHWQLDLTDAGRELLASEP